MNATLLKRLFRAISAGSTESALRIATSVVEDERRKGHGALAAELEQILVISQNNTSPDRTDTRSNPSQSLTPLPTSRRHQEPLAGFVLPENLRHHMVLRADIETRFQRIECEYAASERLALHGLRPRKKILLYGPPGCGKSLGAERLAWNTGLPLMKVRFDCIMSSYFGESASNLRTVFEATKESPRVLFLDECDFVARSRTSNNDVGEGPRIVNTVLQLLEDYDAPGLVVAATNLSESLDKAIFRRFDDVFEVPLPGDYEIRELLRVSLSAIRVEKNIDWEHLVHLLSGQSAANVVKAAQNSAKTAILTSELPIQEYHIVRAIEEIKRND
jgi:SpoVK/Ycf46/Vps4 family AAA+-type ATPase